MEVNGGRVRENIIAKNIHAKNIFAENIFVKNIFKKTHQKYFQKNTYAKCFSKKKGVGEGPLAARRA